MRGFEASSGPLLLRKGRVLDPRSRLRYRWWLIRTGRSVAFRADEFSLLLIPLRALTLPLVTAFDFLAWPIVRRVMGRGRWYVVQTRIHDEVEIEMVRIAEADDYS